MSELLTRAFTPDLEIRSAAKGGDGRTIVGIAVPYRRPQRIDERLTEQFARGAFNQQLKTPQRVPFAREHLPLGGTLIGRSLMYRDDAAGLYGEWRVSATPAGDETLELVKDGALSQLSIGFRERQNRRLTGGVIERVTAELREVAVVLEGAYGDGAMVSEVRSGHDVDDAHVCAMCGAPTGTARLDKARQMLASLPILPAS